VKPELHAGVPDLVREGGGSLREKKERIHIK
jgi:hypothetical protein